VRDGGHEQRGHRAQKRRRPDEGHRRVGAPRGAAVPREAILMGIVGACGIGDRVARIDLAGKAVFGVAAQPRWIVYPFSVAITVVVSIASAFPLRRLASIRPASVFRGEA